MTTRAEFVQKARAAGLSDDKIKAAMVTRREKVGAFDDDPGAAPALAAQPTQQAPAPNLTPEESSGLQGAARAAFPRSFKANDEGAGLGRKLMAAGGDAVSGILRIPAALGRMGDTKLGLSGDHPQGFTESLNQINAGNAPDNQKSVLSTMEQDPATVATALVPLGKAAQGAKWGAKVLNGMVQGTKLGTVGAAVHQADNAGQGKDVSLGDAAKEVAASAAVGGALPILGGIAQAGGKKIINSLVRPSTTVERFGYGAEGRASDQVGKNTTDAIFEQGVDANSLSGMANKITARKGEIGQEINQAIAQGQAAGNKVDPYKVLDDVVSEIEKSPEKFRGPLSKLQDAKGEILAELDALHAIKKAAPGSMDLAGVQGWKSRVGGMGNWESTKGGTATQELAKMVNRKLDQEIDRAAPGIDKLNEGYQQMKSAGRALEERLPVHNRNNAVSLSTLAALMGGPKVLLGQLASKSPAVARGLYHGGNVLGQPRLLQGLKLLDAKGPEEE